MAYATLTNFIKKHDPLYSYNLKSSIKKIKDITINLVYIIFQLNKKIIRKNQFYQSIFVKVITKDKKILMFLKSDRIQKRQNHSKNPSLLDSNSYRQKNQYKSAIKNQDNIQDDLKVDKQKFKLTSSSINVATPTHQKRGRLLSFQNDYVKAAARKMIILDQRKLLIKEKIKVKVKEQLADILKRMDSVPNEQKNAQNKDQNTKKQLQEVKIKGKSVKRSLRNSLSCRPQFLKQDKIRTLDKRQRSEIKQKDINKKLINTQFSPRFDSKIQSPVSKAIRLRDISPRKYTRKIHSALDGISNIQKNPSWEIEPWKFVEDF